MDGSSGGLSTGDGAIATLAMWTDANAYGPIFLPGEMRAAPSLSDWSNLVWFHKGNTWTVTSGNIHFAGACTNIGCFYLDCIAIMSPCCSTVSTIVDCTALVLCHLAAVLCPQL